MGLRIDPDAGPAPTAPDRSAPDGNAALDALRFALAPRPHPGRRWAGIALRLASHPARALAILRDRLAGRRLRARQALIALIGVDHRLTLPARRAPSPEEARGDAADPVGTLDPDALGGPLRGGAPVIVLLPPGHLLVAGARARIATAFAREPELRALYGDALVAFTEGGPLLPLLRPAFDPDYLRAVDYVGPVVALRRSAVEAVGTAGLDPDAAATDLILRVSARFGRTAVGHLPAVLSLWRPGRGSRPPGRARAARLDAVRRSLEREGAPGVHPEADGVIRVAWPLPEPPPLVSLIVPTRDRLDLLEPCIRGLVERTDWPATEILIVDNGSREPATHAYLRALAGSGRARVIAHPGPFNFAAMNNAAAVEARGTLLAFVNNDVEAFRPDWLERLCREALRPEVGAVGAKLLDGAGRIQHGGVVLGAGGLVGHGHRHFAGEAIGYLSGLRATRAVSAVTAACLVVEAGKFRAVGGFDAQAFAVDFNDVDLCLRLNAAGHRTMLVPGAVLHHREAASRRWTPQAWARHRAEVARFEERWGALLAGDPHYHPGFDPDLSTHARLRADWTGTGPAEPR